MINPMDTISSGDGEEEDAESICSIENQGDAPVVIVKGENTRLSVSQAGTFTCLSLQSNNP